MVSDALIRIENLSCSFGPKGRKVLDDVSLTVDRGEFVILAGPSGSGKTTLANCIKGVVPQLVGGTVEGSISVCGLDPRTESPAQLAQRVGMVFQDPESQLCNLFIQDELAFGLENLRFAPNSIKDRVKGALSFLGLKDTDQRLVYEASGGQKQRIAIGSVLVMEPEIFIFDDPTANLDPKGSREVFATIEDLHRQGRTIILITHYLDDALSFADRLVVLNHGRKVIDDTPSRVLAEFGLDLPRRYGVRLPQVSELALQLGSILAWKRIPLSPEQFYEEGVDQLACLVGYGTCSVCGQVRTAYGSSAPGAGIVAKDINFYYHNGTQALKGVSFEINLGERVAIAGNNGSGKTTLAKLMLGLLRPTQGTMSTCGMRVGKVRNSSITRKVGYVFQYPEHQFVKENVFDEVAYGMRVAGLDENTIRSRVREMLDLFGLSGLENRHPLTLSGGERRRLSVITMLVVSPQVLILDEPTFGQDPANAARLMELVFSDVDVGTSVTPIVISHDMSIIAQYCQRVLVMSDGQMLYDGTPAELFLHRQAVLDASSLRRVFVAELISRLIDKGSHLPGNIVTPGQFVEWVNSVVSKRVRE